MERIGNGQRENSTLTSTEFIFISASGTRACSVSFRNGWNLVHPVRLWLFSSQHNYSVVALLTGVFVRRSGSVRLKFILLRQEGKKIVFNANP